MAAVALLQGALLSGPAAAAGDAPNQTWATAPEALRQLTDPGGWRTRLEQAGLKFTFSYYGDALGNPSGGVVQGLGYDGRFGQILDADLAKLAGWSGATFHASIHEIFGTQFSANNVQSLATVSGVEAPPSVRLFNLWIEQKIGGDANVRFGQFTAAQEFLVSKNANLFVNATLGWPLLTSQDLPGGGPNYPIGAPGVRLAWTPTEQITLRAAVFDGDPAGAGSGNPVSSDPYGLAFRVRDPPLLLGEVAYAYNHAGAARREDQQNPNQEGDGAQTQQQVSGAPTRSGGLPGTVKLGAMVLTGQFTEQLFGSLAGSPALSTVPALQHSGDFIAYGVIDQMLWRVPGGPGARALNGFMRVAVAPDNRNAVGLYLDSGLTFRGMIGSRPNDQIGLAVAYGRVSPPVAAYYGDVVTTTGTPMPIPDYETTIELTYRAQLAPDLSLQPDLQYIIHPGGNVANPRDPSGATAIPNAFVVGLRTILKF